MRSTQEDLTTKARIRDAAIRRFAADGLDAPLRLIAADAGVSPGLIMHHFSSRAGLREACDEYVLARARDSKKEVLGEAGPGAMLAGLAQIEGYASLVGYVLRCLQAGGPLTDRFVDAIVADAVSYLADGVAAGTVSPSRDPEARARLIAEMSLGALLLQLPARQSHLDLEELPQWLHQYSARIVLPLLELYTQPLLTESGLLDAYLESIDRSKAQ
ncbi:TetR family transcriptional regulator [Tessaracoccus sp. OS52]|uniref:TetR/AcrR family transcriptional regulator n=1 Tax=Tessaracoccus sp. OS52 TaxID=2886691 RepID=UPI001D1124EA|nr:TetR family transcriptional regulator [Tessaracoccus sp. OS52]MCC2592408.1 TetR family transcriptional regulator [Tessaracoccus sp. OS52]